jgi:hypothetical protein
VLGIGTYRVAVGHEAREAIQPELPTGFLNRDFGANDVQSKATDLGVARPGADARWDFTGTASLFRDGGVADIDFYKVKTAKDAAQPVAVAIVSALDPTALHPSVEVFDKDGNRLRWRCCRTPAGR